MIASRDNCYLPSLMWVTLALAAILLGIANFDALRVNLIFLGLERVLAEPEMTLEQKVAVLRDIRLAGDQVSNVISVRQRNALTSVDRLLAQVDHQSTVYSTLSNWSALDWKPWRLPNAVPLGANVSLLGVIVISDDADFALGNPIRLALLLQPNQLDVQAQQVKVDSAGWSVIETPAGWVAVGSLPNWVQNAGFEWPSPDSWAIGGLFSPANWGIGDADAFQRLKLKEVDAQQPGQSACAVGAVRVMPPFHPAVAGHWALFGMRFRAVHGIEAQPYLMAMSPSDGSVPAAERLAVVNMVKGWKTGYGILRMQDGWLVSLVTDTPDGLQNENCLDNLFIVVLPDIRFVSDAR